MAIVRGASAVERRVMCPFRIRDGTKMMSAPPVIESRQVLGIDDDRGVTGLRGSRRFLQVVVEFRCEDDSARWSSLPLGVLHCRFARLGT